MRSYSSSSDPAVEIVAVQTDGVHYDAVLLLGELGGEVDWAVAQFPDTHDDDTDPGHAAAFEDAPIKVRGSMLREREPVRHASSPRHKRMTGVIHSFSATPIQLRVGPDVVEYSGVVIIESGDEPFSIEGDSGSLIVDDERLAWGLVLGGSDDGLYSYALTLPPLLQRLGTKASAFFDV